MVDRPESVRSGVTASSAAMGWWFDEFAHAGPEHLDPAYVAGFDQKARSDWSEEVATLLACGIGRTSTVVDLGAGTGTFAQAIAPHVARVVAVDVSEVMVEAMQRRSNTRWISQLRAPRRPAGRGLYLQRATSPPRFLEGDRTGPHRRSPTAWRRTSAAGSRLLL